MILSYETSKGHKFSEENIHNQGCIPNTGVSSEMYMDFQAGTPHELLGKILKYFGVDKGCVSIQPCDQYGHIDIAVTEDEYGNIPSKRNIARWKVGQFRLWKSTYTFKVYRVRRELVNL